MEQSSIQVCAINDNTAYTLRSNNEIKLYVSLYNIVSFVCREVIRRFFEYPAHKKTSRYNRLIHKYVKNDRSIAP